MKKMSSLPGDSDAKPKLPVCRQLFFKNYDPVQEAANDNFSNFLQETARRNGLSMSQTWNFDFDNEEPLEGPYEWYKKDEDSWIGMKPDPTTPSTDDTDKFIPIEEKNQTTPKVPTGEAAPAVRKRKGLEVVNEKRSKRRISFD